MMVKHWLVTIVGLVCLAGMVLPGSVGLTHAFFADIESISGNTFTAWKSDNWTQTYTTEFNLGIPVNVDTSNDEVKLNYFSGNGTITRSPSGSNGGWTNPTGAYADNGTYAYVASGTPSPGENYTNYGFSLTGATITKVRVRLDAWCSASANATYALRPIANFGTQQLTPVGSTLNYQNVDEVTENISDYNYNPLQKGGALIDRYTLSSPPSDIFGGTIDNVTVYARLMAAASGQGNIGKLGIRMGSIDYGMTPQSLTNANTTYRQSFIVDPSDNLTWQWSDLNSLVAVCSLENQNGANKETYVYQLWADIYYRAANNEQIRLEVSRNSGATWSGPYSENLTGSETTYWIDVTGSGWTPAQLSDANFRVRVTGYTVGDPGEVRLDWIPVEVIYTGLMGYQSPGTLASQVYNTGVAGATWDALLWDENVPAGTDITFAVRASNTSFAADNATLAWIPVGGTSGQPTNPLPSGQYKQWRATLTTTNPAVTPILYEVRVWYDP